MIEKIDRSLSIADILIELDLSELSEAQLTKLMIYLLNRNPNLLTIQEVIGFWQLFDTSLLAWLITRVDVADKVFSLIPIDSLLIPMARNIKLKKMHYQRLLDTHMPIDFDTFQRILAYLKVETRIDENGLPIPDDRPINLLAYSTVLEVVQNGKNIAPVSDWSNRFTGQDAESVETDTFVLPSVTLIAKWLMLDSTKYFQLPAEQKYLVRTKLVEQLTDLDALSILYAMSNIYVEQILKPFNLEMDLALGPVNPVVTLEPSTAMQHMFQGSDTFDESEYSENSRKIAGWFSGYCDYCQFEIKEYWQAVRIPMVAGDWQNNSYCSWQHAKACTDCPLVKTMIDYFASL